MKKNLWILFLSVCVFIGAAKEVNADSQLWVNGYFDIITINSTYKNIVDNDENTYFTQYSLFVIEFEEPINVKKFRTKAWASGQYVTIEFKNANDQTILKPNVYNNSNPTELYREIVFTSTVLVKRIIFHSPPTGHHIKFYEMELFPDDNPPEVPSGLTAIADTELVTLNWNQNMESDLLGYNVFVNGEKVNEDIVLTNKYTVEGLTGGINYGFQVTAIDIFGNESNKSQVVYAQPWTPPLFPTLTFTNLKDSSVRLTWSSTSANEYRVYKNNEYLTKTINLFSDVTQLEPNTDYEFKIIAIDQYGRLNESNVVVVKTLPPMPIKPNVRVINKTHDSIAIDWDDDVNTITYEIYLNNEKIETVNSSEYVFENLNADSVYAIKIVALGLNGSQVTQFSVRTELVPVPRINYAYTTNHPSQTTKKILKYEPNEHVTSVKVFLDGVLIGEYPVNQKEIELDFSEVKESFANVRLEPSGNGAVPYEFQALAKSTGLEQVDNLLSRFIQGFLLNKNAFWYLALILLPLTIAVMIFIWLRHKFKKTFGESKKEARTLINQPSGEMQYIRDIKEERRNFIPWKEMTQEQRNEWRQKKGKPPRKPLTDAEKTNFEVGNKIRIVEKNYKKVPIGFFGIGGFKYKPDFTYEQNGIHYKKRYVKGKGMVFKPKDFENQIKHVSHQMNTIKRVFTGSNKKFF